MKEILTILLTLVTLVTFGQNGEKKLRNIACEHYLDKDYDSALIYYQKLIQKPKFSNDPYYLKQIGDCYSHLNLPSKAKENYLKCVQDASAGLLSPKRDCSLQLAEVYISEIKYDSALYYIQLAEKQWPHLRICSAGEFERETQINYKFAICFNGTGQLDSAIKYITPYAFSASDRLEPFVDSTEYKKIVDFYLTLLGKNNSDQEIKNEFHRAVDNLTYIKELDKESKEKYPEDNWYNVNCYLDIFGERITLVDGGYEATSWGGEPVKAYSKESLIETLKESVAFREIMNK
jgi:tetratricopeptide (TPR) repeat protein